VTAHLAPAFLFTGLDVLFMAAVGVLLLVAAITARLLVRATPPFVAADIELTSLESHVADGAPAERHAAAG
jgi:hypothetical protein